MMKLALFARFEARPGKEEEVEKFLKKALDLASQEPTTLMWFALKLDSRVYGVFDAFGDENGRQKHLTGPIAKALMGSYPDLLVAPASIEKIDLLGVKDMR
jgi:quinol monooxygenase YgiN